jgi:hypothetical protein
LHRLPCLALPCRSTWNSRPAPWAPSSHDVWREWCSSEEQRVTGCCVEVSAQWRQAARRSASRRRAREWAARRRVRRRRRRGRHTLRASAARTRAPQARNTPAPAPPAHRVPLTALAPLHATGFHGRRPRPHGVPHAHRLSCCPAARRGSRLPRPYACAAWASPLSCALPRMRTTCMNNMLCAHMHSPLPAVRARVVWSVPLCCWRDECAP